MRLHEITGHPLPPHFTQVEPEPGEVDDPWFDRSAVKFETPTGGGILGGVEWNKGSCTIEHFWATDDGKGNGRRTLQWLRRYFPNHIEIQKPGYPGDGSLAFWKKMQAEGLVDVVLDDEHFRQEPGGR